MASQNFNEINSATPSMSSIIDARVIASFDFVVTRDWVTNDTDNKTPKLRSGYEPFLRFFIAYNAETKSVIPVFKNLRGQCLEKFTVLATDNCAGDTSFIDFTKLEKMQGDDPSSNLHAGNTPVKVDGKLAHIRCMEQNCPKKYYPGEHVKVYESFETAKPLRLFLSPNQSAYLHWVVYAAVNFSKKHERHDLYRFPPYDEYSGKKTLGYLIDLDQKVAYYPNEGIEEVPIYSVPLPTAEGKANSIVANSIVGPARIYIKDHGDRVHSIDVREKAAGVLFKDEMKTHHVLEFKHFVLDNGEEDLPVENKSSCSSCIDINYDNGCAVGIGGGEQEMGTHCPVNEIRRRCYHNDEATMGGASYLKIYTKEYLSCWNVDEEIYIKGEDKYISGKPKTIKAIVKHKGTDRWARNWIKVERYDAEGYLNLKRPLKLIHACSQIYDTEERIICFCDCNGHSVKMKVLVTEDLSTYESCQGSGTSLGVCCINGACSEISRQACEVANGIWIDNKKCNDATPPCSEVLGVCCVGAQCSITTQLSCDNANGVWRPATPGNPASCTDPADPCAGSVILRLTNANSDAIRCGQTDVNIVTEAEGPLHPGSLAVVVYEGAGTPISDKIFFDSLGHFALRQKTINLHPGKIWTDASYATAYSSWSCGGAILHRQYDIATTPGSAMSHTFEWFLTMHD